MPNFICICGHFPISHSKFYNISKIYNRTDKCIHPSHCLCKAYKQDNLKYLEQKHEENLNK